MSKYSYENILETVPVHLQSYVVDQKYNRYMAQDQAVWRYIMRKNLDFLSKHAHPSYIEGLETTGHAPIIADQSYAEYLQKFGEYGSKAMASKLDFDVYEAIRHLSNSMVPVCFRQLVKESVLFLPVLLIKKIIMFCHQNLKKRQSRLITRLKKNIFTLSINRSGI